MRAYLGLVIVALVACRGGSSGGKPCTSDGECAIGQLCSGEYCTDGCRGPRDCPPDRPICDPSIGALGGCVECATGADCDPGEACTNGTCRKRCDDDGDCGGQTCDKAQHVCVECTDSSHCALGNICVEQACTAGCTRDRDCPSTKPSCDPDAGPHGTCYECQLDGQCDGGEKCVDHQCRQVCTTNTECPTNICDPSSHTCVECLTKAHCLVGEVCVAKVCEVGCEVDGDCPTNTPACDPAAGAHGTCYVCTGDSDCGPNGHCANHLCEGDAAAMVDLPAGSFVMGSDADSDTDNRRHIVTLSAYSIDRHEVTNARYKQCVLAGACQLPSTTTAYNDPLKAQHPVNYVDWAKASAFCAWAGKRLPTEAEWERAARSADERTYPWGAATPTCTLTNYGQTYPIGSACVGATTAVGMYPTGASAAGVLDMAGNVREWVSDWYAVYPAGNDTNPTGPATGTDKIARGGSFLSPTSGLTTYVRPARAPTDSSDVVGFRCVKAGAVPVASFTVSPTSGSTSDVFVVDASGSTDPTYPASQLQVRWDWTDDGTYDTAFTTTKTAQHQYATGGTYTIRGEVKNPVGVSRTTTRTVSVAGNGTGTQGSPCTATSQCMSGLLCAFDGSSLYCGWECASQPIICLIVAQSTTCTATLDVDLNQVSVCQM